MERTCFLLFLCAAAEGDVGQHVYVPSPMTWHNARNYCRDHYTDLSFVNSQKGTNRLLAAAGSNNVEGWIGLQRDPANMSAWYWSGGAHITYQNWAHGQPDNFGSNEMVAAILSNGEWNDDKEFSTKPFYCISVTTVDKRKSWEEALDHCRENHTILTSLLSETEQLLAQVGIQEVNITERVWIGLRYLEGGWLWVNGDPLVYQAWPQGGDQDHQCPTQRRCGALTIEGLWENWDCQDQLNFICM